MWMFPGPRRYSGIYGVPPLNIGSMVSARAEGEQLAGSQGRQDPWSGTGAKRAACLPEYPLFNGYVILALISLLRRRLSKSAIPGASSTNAFRSISRTITPILSPGMPMGARMFESPRIRHLPRCLSRGDPRD